MGVKLGLAPNGKIHRSRVSGKKVLRTIFGSS